ncbi:hypothetical protein BD626DRAFT_516982 [Schizophyllum amplum]|uniref:Glucose-methanol-choline oxidoreductase N-terminal domain-containing protein n=1 Tax=Schizophyllum amplum TaxID=97359 RepID=A0A550BWQ2_9AGAR|nr:hypothetical protein BD626DRAFT_516982 [Auriculariopsis ampla]
MRRSAVAAALVASVVAQTTITDDASVASSKSFDYIIAGGGLTGLTVANKLSAAGKTVLVVEAGPNSEDVTSVNVATARGGITAAECNWKYDALGDDGSALGWQIDSGRCLGGSSSINGMVWFHPTKPEMDALKNLGNKGWDWNSLYPYMKAVEHNHLPNDAQRADGANVDQGLHGYSGPVNVSFPDAMRIPDAQRLYKAAMPLVFEGLKLSDDLSDRDNSAMASTSWTIWNDESSGTDVVRRSSAAHAFLYAEDQQRSTLTVLYNHKVLSVTFDSKIKATGIQFGPSDGGSIMTASAKKEVLLASGSLQTPPILERSGYPEQFGIDALVDLPAVGRNLQDQPGTGASALVNDANATNTELIDNINLFAPVISLVNMDELFGSNSSAKGAALTKSINAKAQAAVDAGTMVSKKSAQAVFGAQANLIVRNKMPIAEVVGESYPSVMTSVFWPLLPFSRGHVHIASSDPFASPAITPRLLSDDFDVSVAISVAKKAQSMFTTEPFAPVISHRARQTDDWEAWYKKTAYAASHWLGSSSMLPREYGGVGNNKLQVYGTKNLRVIDASILPMPITSPQCPRLQADHLYADAIAQKAADIILGKDKSVN